jgi:S-adenosylmethionine synthetase
MGAKGEVGSFIFTSESAFEGHPDKLADQIADAIVDACLAQDDNSKVAAEVCVHNGMVMMLGELSSKAKVDFEELARETCRELGYDSDEAGLDCDAMEVFNRLEAQSPDVAQAVHGHFTKAVEELGAGDCGVICGYATDETPELMPLTKLLATRLSCQIARVRRSGELPWLRSDGIAQVAVEYTTGEGGSLIPKRVQAVVIRAQHAQDIDESRVVTDLYNSVVLPVLTLLPSHLVDGQTSIQINPSGRFVDGGPKVCAGVSGRRLADDTYGGWGMHGGGSISGKDGSKMDRTAAYAARWVAKSLVHSGLCARCTVQLSYAISLVQPMSLTVYSYGTARPDLCDADLCRLVAESFDLRPGALIEELRLQEPRFRAFAAFGHFGQRGSFETEQAVPEWEVPRTLLACKRYSELLL